MLPLEMDKCCEEEGRGADRIISGVNLNPNTFETVFNDTVVGGQNNEGEFSILSA